MPPKKRTRTAKLFEQNEEQEVASGSENESPVRTTRGNKGNRPIRSNKQARGKQQGESDEEAEEAAPSNVKAKGNKGKTSPPKKAKRNASPEQKEADDPPPKKRGRKEPAEPKTRLTRSKSRTPPPQKEAKEEGESDDEGNQRQPEEEADEEQSNKRKKPKVAKSKAKPKATKASKSKSRAKTPPLNTLPMDDDQDVDEFQPGLSLPLPTSKSSVDDIPTKKSKSLRGSRAPSPKNWPGGTSDAPVVIPVPVFSPVSLKAGLDRVTFLPKAHRRTATSQSEVKEFKEITTKQAQALLDSHPKVKHMRDRTKSVAVEVFLLSTLTSGLPAFNSKPKVQSEIKHCLNYIFYRLHQEKDTKVKEGYVMELAKAYEACQALQYQAITSIYARLCLVELGFEQQAAKMLDQYKNRTLDEVVLLLNPKANVTPDSAPQQQAPHIRSAYLLAIDKQLAIEFEGKDAAQLDVNQPQLDAKQEKKVAAVFKDMFHAGKFVLDFMTDINQKKGGFSHTIDRDKFYQWVMKLDDSNFDKFSIFYDSDRADEFEGGAADAPADKDQHLIPYLSPAAARRVLGLLAMVK